jgi:ABC-2 type transport system permease protein
MKAVVHHIRVYQALLRILISYVLTYRLNALVRSIFFPVWQVVMLVIIVVVFSHTDSIGGWTQTEVLILYFINQILLSLTYALYFEGGARYLLYTAVHTGALDQHLAKPVSPYFMVFFGRPHFDSLLGGLLMTIAFALFLIHENISFTSTQLLSFGLITILSQIAVFFIVASYSMLAFFFERVQQVAEILDKANELGQYPTSMFPSSVQGLAISLIPVAFMGFVPVSFLLGKGTMAMVGITLLALTASYALQHWLWKRGLKAYSSVST